MSETESISIIIPTFNEAQNLSKLIPFLKSLGEEKITEILVVDAQSSDNSSVIAEHLGATVLNCSTRSRASQLNAGAKIAKGSILYFVHADSVPLKSLAVDIFESLQAGHQAGCFRYEFDSPDPMLKINSWCSGLNGIFTGGGDQTLFIEKTTFWNLGGYDEKFTIMEDFELVKRIKKITKFKVIQKSILVSARKYKANSWLKVQLANGLAMLAFHFGVKPERIKTLYYNRLN